MIFNATFNNISAQKRMQLF